MAPHLSSRLMAFLFTDLVDSTGMKKRLGDKKYVQEVLQPHNQMFEDLIAKYPSGKIRDNAGDGYFATFKSLQECVEFALQFQHELRSRGWAEQPFVRVGVHLGDAVNFKDFGGGKKTAAKGKASTKSRAKSQPLKKAG